MADVQGRGRRMAQEASVQEVRVPSGIQETSLPLGGGSAASAPCQAELQTAACFSGYVRFHVFQRSGPCRFEGTDLQEHPYGFRWRYLADGQPCEDESALRGQAAPDSRGTYREVPGREGGQSLSGQGVSGRKPQDDGGQLETHR